MTTPSRRAFVSLAALTLTLALGACVRAPSRPLAAPPVTASPTIRFDNLAREHVHVYLIGLKREWLLGRVEPGAITSLRLPEDALVEESPMRLAVLAGQRAVQQAACHPRATLTLAQPAEAFLSQQWSFSQGQLLSLRR